MGLLGSLDEQDRALGLLNLGAGMIAGNRGTSKGAAFQNAVGAGMGNFTNTLALLGRQGLARDELSQREAVRRQQEELMRQRAMELERQQAAMQAFAQTLPPELRALAAVAPGAAIERAFPKKEGYTLAPGAQRFDENNRPVASAPTAPPEFIRLLEGMGIKQGDPRFDQLVGQYLNKQTTHAPPVSVNNFPNPIPVVGPDGKPTLVQFGSKGEIRDTGMRPPVTAAERKAEQDLKKEDMRAENVVSQAESVLQTITEAKDMIGPMTAGIGGAVVSKVPGTPAYDLQQKVLTVKANIGFDRLQQMREASPTGGALGQVAVQELNSLQATIASLDPNQSPSQVRAGLEKVEKHYSKWLDTVKQSQGAPAQQRPSAPQRGEVRGGYEYLGGDPSSPMSWRKK